MTCFTKSNPPSGYYVYAYLRENGTPFYIGKGIRRRAWADNHGVHLPSNHDRIVILWDNLDEEFAHEMEMLLISTYGRLDLKTGCLRNRTDGGEGTSNRVIVIDDIDTEYIWHHAEKNITVTASRSEMRRLYDLNTCRLKMLIKGERKIMLGWTLLSVDQIEHTFIDKKRGPSIPAYRERNANFDATIRSWTNMNTGETVMMTSYDLIRAYNLHDGVTQIIKQTGRVKSCKGWVLTDTPYDAKSRPIDLDRAYHWQHIETEEIVVATRPEMAERTGGTLSNFLKVMQGLRKSHRGWTLIKE